MDLGDEYQPVLDYMEDNYIGRLRGRSRHTATFPIHFWNMTPRVKNNMHRTNNNIEAWHRKLNCISMYSSKLMDIYGKIN